MERQIQRFIFRRVVRRTADSQESGRRARPVQKTFKRQLVNAALAQLNGLENLRGECSFRLPARLSLECRNRKSGPSAIVLV